MRLHEVVERALDLDPQERSAYLDEVCGNDTSLRQELEALFSDPPPTEAVPAPNAVPTEILPVLGSGAAAGALRIGAVVDGKYRIDGMLGAGGMGAVFLAVTLNSSERRPQGHPQRTRRPTLMAERFRREAVAVARLRHPHIVTVHDYGDAPTSAPIS